MIYYHWIVENTTTGERYETITKTKRAPRFNPPWRVVACCGFHETPREKENSYNMED